MSPGPGGIWADLKMPRITVSRGTLGWSAHPRDYRKTGRITHGNKTEDAKGDVRDLAESRSGYGLVVKKRLPIRSVICFSDVPMVLRVPSNVSMRREFGVKS